MSIILFNFDVLEKNGNHTCRHFQNSLISYYHLGASLGYDHRICKRSFPASEKCLFLNLISFSTDFDDVIYIFSIIMKLSDLVKIILLSSSFVRI